MVTGWRSVTQLHRQKKQFTHEILHILNALGKREAITGYISMGDEGKLVLSLRERLPQLTTVFVAHDCASDTIPAVRQLRPGGPVRPLQLRG